MSFADDLKALLEKHGMKEGDINPDSKSKGGQEPQNPVNPEVVSKLSGEIVDALVKAFDARDNAADKKNKDSRSQLVSKVFTSWAGVKEVAYPSDLMSLTKDEKIVNFFKALYFSKADPDNSGKVLRALAEGTDSEGGYLVPEELRAEVFRILPDFTVMRNIARVIPMSTDTLKLNSLTARPVAYWTAEYQSKSTTSAEFGQVTLQPNDLVCLLPVTEQLLADANINLVQFIIELFAEAIGVAEDKAFFTGSGTGQPRGISQETLSTVDANGNLTMDHILSLEYKVPQRVRRSNGAAFVAHQAVVEHLRKLKDSNGNYIWRDASVSVANTESQGMRPVPTLHGYPFYEQNDLSQDELYFGDWKYYIIGDRQTISVRTTTEGGEAWRRNAMEIKAVERVDGRAVIVRPFAKVTNIQS